MTTWQEDRVRLFVQADPDGTGFPVDNARGLGLIPERTILNHTYCFPKQPQVISMQGHCRHPGGNCKGWEPGCSQQQSAPSVCTKLEDVSTRPLSWAMVRQKP